MDIRSPLLDSKIARDNIMGAGLNVPEVNQSFEAIDSLGALYDALKAAQKTVNPTETPEARALRYEQQFTKSVARARDLTVSAIERLDVFAAGLEARAIYEAGLSEEPSSAPEIRSALRSMSAEDREKAIAKAFRENDVEVLASIYRASQVTWGGTKEPVNEMFAHYVDSAAPELVRQRQAVASVTQGLELAAETFIKSANKWRDPIAADRGERQQEEYAQADAALKAALG